MLPSLERTIDGMGEISELLEKIGLIFDAVAICDEHDVFSHLRAVRNLCSKGASIQELVANHSELQEFLHAILLEERQGLAPQHEERTILMAWQLWANMIVGNKTTQALLWQRHGKEILQGCAKAPVQRYADIQLMIMYNILKANTGVLSEQEVLESAIKVWRAIIEEKCDSRFAFLHLTFELFVVDEGLSTVRCYAKLQSEQRINFLDYIATYVSNDSPNGPVHTFVLNYFAKEFKIKSDCILRQTSGGDNVAKVQPREAYALLKVIAGVSGSEMYQTVYATDHSLFLNVSSVLRCLVAAGKETQQNIFTPLNKLEEVATTSNTSREFETEISYELKTLLVRCVANLLYKNPTNQGYCADTQLMAALFECTNMDARNPLMREWSILAIRNACVGCEANQATIAKLTKVGNAQNDLMSELNLEMGALRISSSSKKE